MRATGAGALSPARPTTALAQAPAAPAVFAALLVFQAGAADPDPLTPPC
jgi:hypothetical protein